MTRTIDMKAYVAHLTGTEPTSWEPFMGRKEGIGIEQAFTEVGDGFGPYDEDVADMIEEGFTSGPRWELETKEDLEENEDAKYEIARLIRGGFTSGFRPTWSVSMEKIMPGEAYVQIDDDEFVTVKMDATENHEAINFVTSIDEIARNPVTAAFVVEPSTTPTP